MGEKEKTGGREGGAGEERMGRQIGRRARVLQKVHLERNGGFGTRRVEQPFVIAVLALLAHVGGTAICSVLCCSVGGTTITVIPDVEAGG